jgi:signal peptidase
MNREEESMKSSGKKKKITDGPMGYVIYAALGIFIAFLVNQGLAVALSTDLPVVAVVSGSMVHDSTITESHYLWLQDNMGYNRTYVESWPVKDGFNVGDMPIIQGVKDYKVGDVIVYSTPGQSAPIIHRIIKVNPDGTFQTKGDHNPQQLPFEFKIQKSWIHGKVIFVVPKVGYFKVLVSKLTGEA